MTAVPLQLPRRLIEFALDGQETRVPEGSTILDACRAAGKDIPDAVPGRHTHVDACGEHWQNTFAVAGRGFDARISTEHDAPLTDSACVYCGNCIEVCPTGALSFRTEFDMRAAGTWDEPARTETTTVCAHCGVGCNVTLHVQDNEIVKVTSPHDNPVTHGNLCIKGRFGFQHVQNRV